MEKGCEIRLWMGKRSLEKKRLLKEFLSAAFFSFESLTPLHNQPMITHQLFVHIVQNATTFIHGDVELCTTWGFTLKTPAAIPAWNSRMHPCSHFIHGVVRFERHGGGLLH